ncbi:MAG: EAL domain-containing protein [Betaproteobacteria bacterium]
MTVGQSGQFAMPPSRLFALLLGLFVSALALSVFLGWLLDIASLRSALSTGAPMRANAAAALAVSGLALAALALPWFRTQVQAIAFAVGVAVAVLGALTLSQDLGGWNLGIDQWLIQDVTGSARVAIPGRMSPPSSFSLILVGGALALAARPVSSQLRSAALAGLAVAVILIGGIALLGHTSERLLEIRFLSYSRIAAYSALALALMGIGLIALLRAEGGLEWSLDKVTTAGFAAGIAAMVVTAGISYQFTAKMRSDAVGVSGSLEVLRDIQHLNVRLGDFTLSTGRYLITRDERALAGREGIKAEIWERFDSLRSIVAWDPAQRARLNQIVELHSRRIAMSDEIIAGFRDRIRRGDLPGPGDPSPLGQEYPALGVEIERLAKQMEVDEYARLERVRREADANSAETFLLLPLGVLLGLTILSLGLFFLNWNAGERRRAQAALAHRGEHLAMLHDIDRAIIAGKTPADIALAALPRLQALLQLPRVIVNLVDLQRGEAEWLAAVGRRRGHYGPGVRFPLDLLGDVEGLKRGEVQLIDTANLAQKDEAAALLASGVRWYRVVPMIAGGELIGGLSFGGESRELDEETLRIARDTAAQLAIAISQARLAMRAKEADARFRLVFENVPVGISMTTMGGRLLSANPALARMLGYDTVEEWIQAATGTVRGLYRDPSARTAYLDVLRRDGFVSGFECQFLRRDGSPVWVAMSGRPIHDVRGEDSRLVTMIADISQRKEHEARIARLSRVKDMQSAINAATIRHRRRDALLEDVCRIAVEVGGLRAAWVVWHDEVAHRLRPVASAGELGDILKSVELPTDVEPERADSVAVRVLLGGASIVTDDLGVPSRNALRAAAVEHGLLSAMHLPLVAGGAAPAGVLAFCSGEVGFFHADERQLLEELAADVSFALDALRKSERLDYLAYYDPLTGLPNRTLFHNRLSHSLRQRGGDSRLVAVILLDLERFRQVNETLGRQHGDRLLRAVAERLQRAGESAARIGSDLFGLTLRGARDAAEVNRALEAVVAATFSTPFQVGGEDLIVACRVGVAIFPDDAVDADALTGNAEAALKRGKTTGERVTFYSPDLNARVAESLSLETRLRRAVEQRQFVLHYQPKVDLADGSVAGAEALIRWQVPDGELVPPVRFIPLLEETGLIVEVGRWAVGQAFRDLNAWAGKGLRVPRVAVNVSMLQLQRKDFVGIIIDEIERGGDHPDWLELEITEGLFMRNVEDATRKLSILRGMGVTVAIDDFGTGYSSLGYLSRLPVDSLKIDRSFILGMASGEQGRNIVTTIIALAAGLKLKVVAEGVETEEQAGQLRSFGCDEAQGYLFSRPLPADAMAAFLARQAPK